jgi:hypothetical protein
MPGAGKVRPSRPHGGSCPGTRRGRRAGVGVPVVRSPHLQYEVISPHTQQSKSAELRAMNGQYVPTQTTCWPSRSAFTAAWILHTLSPCPSPVHSGATFTQTSSSRLRAGRRPQLPSRACTRPTSGGPAGSAGRGVHRAAQRLSTRCAPRGHGGVEGLGTRRRWAVCLGSVSVYKQGAVESILRTRRARRQFILAGHDVLCKSASPVIWRVYCGRA